MKYVILSPETGEPVGRIDKNLLEVVKSTLEEKKQQLAAERKLDELFQILEYIDQLEKLEQTFFFHELNIQVRG